MHQTSKTGTPTTPPVDQTRRRLVKGAGKATAAAAATTLVLASGLKANPAHALTIYGPLPCDCTF